MKNQKRKTYQQPEMKVANLENAGLICTSPSAQNESYEDGDITGWYE